MRGSGEDIVTCYTVTIYGPADKLHDPSGSGQDTESIFNTTNTELKNSLEENVESSLADLFSQWGLRAEITPVA